MSLIEHHAKGDPCSECGQPARKHRKVRIRARDRKIEDREYNSARSKKRKKKASLYPIIGIDGEGITTPDGRHLYTYLAAVDENGKLWAEAYNEFGLSHGECAEVLLSLPKNHLKFGYMFIYDMTKILEELPLEHRYYLMRPDKRKSRRCCDCGHTWTVTRILCPKCKSDNTKDHTPMIRFNSRGYNYQPGSFTVTDGWVSKEKGKGKWSRNVKIWDCFRFFQCSFVQALENWKVGSVEQRARIQSMKVQRGSFATVDPNEVKKYCREECELLGVLMRRVIEAHEEAELDLGGQFQGAGATASALLKKYDVAEYKTDDFKYFDPRLQLAIMSAFFGGRFENSIVGVVREPVYGRDIASAYPYAETFLPCMKCGTWKHISGKGLMHEIEQARLACCHFTVLPVSESHRHEIAWMPLPFRDEKGSICYPTNCSGWAWKPEALSAIAGWPNLVTIDEAWIYNTDCDHHPFEFIPGVYRERVRWGKEGKGIVLKLGSNATYGKTAQNVGSKPFQDWIWAGNTTAYTRGQINALISMSNDPWNMLSIATDGVYTLEDIVCPKPVDTGTSGLLDDKGKPKEQLGGWEAKDVPEGVFFAKPGLYYSLDANVEMKDIRARGVGRRDIHDQRNKLVESFLKWDRKDFDYFVPIQTRRFFGIKHSIHAQSRCTKCGKSWTGCPRDLCPECGRLGDNFQVKMLEKDGKPAYGLWFDMEANIRFDPLPKRERTLDKYGEFSRLRIRDAGGKSSAVYNAATLSPEALEAFLADQMAAEQPDAD
jgi:uncharacterized OB-fold protein